MQKPTLLAALVLIAAVVAAYWPALDGGILWDDEAHVLHPDVQAGASLSAIWLDAGVTARYGQYYPLTRSVFWLGNNFWGGSTFGFHLLNVLLHAASALIVWALLNRLAVPGAWLAAGIFALHPVQVESVAWMTELKNTLSGVFYLGAFIAYARFALPADAARARPWKWYLWALLLFGCALASKTVTATLPAALLVVLWWKRGGLEWKRDVLPTLPFFALGAHFGWMTAVLERDVIGAKGAEYVLSFTERFLVAGRVVWFYLWKLLWPSDLMFIYPRWSVSARSAAQFLFPLAALALLLFFWMRARRTGAPVWRGALCAVLFFGGTLFPVLGFFNVFPFLYSFVADHFQYLASLGIIAFAAAMLASGLSGLGLRDKLSGKLACAGLLAILAGLTWRQCHLYRDAETLWRRTIAANASCWMAHNNLGLLLLDRGDHAAAIQSFEAALRLKPDNAPSYNNLGLAYNSTHKFAEAARAFQRATELRANFTDAYVGWSYAENELGNYAAGERAARAAVASDPARTGAYLNLGIALSRQGKDDDALVAFRRCEELDPRRAQPFAAAGEVYARRGKYEDAVTAYQAALERDPRLAAAHLRLAVLHAEHGETAAAVASYRAALALQPANAAAHLNLGNLLAKQNDRAGAERAWREAVRLDPSGEAGRRARAKIDEPR